MFDQQEKVIPFLESQEWFHHEEARRDTTVVGTFSARRAH